MIQSFIFMCWDFIYVDFLIYFTKNVGAFEVLKFVFISVFEYRFSTRNVLNEFASCRSPNRAYDSFLEIPRYLVCFLKISAINS